MEPMAKVEVTHFSDPGCPWAYSASPALAVLRWRYGDRWRETPRWEYGKVIHTCEPLVDPVIWKRANEALDRREKRGFTDPENCAMLATARTVPRWGRDWCS